MTNTFNKTIKDGACKLDTIKCNYDMIFFDDDTLQNLCLLNKYNY